MPVQVQDLWRNGTRNTMKERICETETDTSKFYVWNKWVSEWAVFYGVRRDTASDTSESNYILGRGRPDWIA